MSNQPVKYTTIKLDKPTRDRLFRVSQFNRRKMADQVRLMVERELQLIIAAEKQAEDQAENQPAE